MGVVSPFFRMENSTVAPFVLQLAQSWTVVPRSTFGELPVRFLPSTFRFRVLVVMGSLLMITLFNCEPLTSSRAYHLWVPSALSTLYPSAVSFRIFFHVAPSANVNSPITAGYFDPASFAPSVGNDRVNAGRGRVLRVAQGGGVAGRSRLDRHRALDGVAVQVKSRVLRAVDGIIAGHVGQQLRGSRRRLCLRQGLSANQQISAAGGCPRHCTRLFQPPRARRSRGR